MDAWIVEQRWEQDGLSPNVPGEEGYTPHAGG